MSKNLDVRKKLQKEMPEFVEVVDAMSADELEERLASLAKDQERTYEAMDEDEKLQSAKEMAREMGAPYSDAKKAIRLKMKYVIEIIREKGGNA